jgi:phosphoribosyl 1,2-cyclic phosphodiesterase
VLDPHLTVRFWGVRGSVPVSCEAQARTGGNTSCVEVGLDGRQPVIIDAGTGIRALGLELMTRPRPGRGEATILLSHLHWDHIQGIPFFAPLYDADWAITFYAARPRDETGHAVRLQTSAPYFPAGWAVKAKLAYEEIHDQGLEAGGMHIRPYHLSHPGGSCGFRLDGGGRTVVYVSDHEHGNAKVDAGLRTWAHGADLLIWDSQYTPEDFHLHQGWGHGTWLEGTRVAVDAEVKQLALFHHDPQRTDTGLDEIEAAARREFSNTVVARQGQEIVLPV